MFRSHLQDRSTVALLVCVVAVAKVTFAVSSTAEIRSFNIRQAIQIDETPPSLRVYSHVVDTEGRPVERIAPSQLQATLGDRALRHRGTSPFRAGSEGIAYVFLVDISRSLSGTEFDLIRDALAAWLRSLRPVDRIAIIAFGDESTLVVDFTDDREAIEAGLDTLGPSDDRTVLHQALRDGLELCSRRDRELPSRRVLLVLSDGRDEGSALTADDVVDLLRDNPVPVYAIGMSRFVNSSQRQAYLDVLRRFAANSGGAFFEASLAGLGDIYDGIRNDIYNALVTDLVCPECRFDGSEYRLQIVIEDDGRVLSDGLMLRLLPRLQSSAVSSAAEPEMTDPIADGNSRRGSGAMQPEGGEEAATTAWGRALLWVVFLLLATATGALALLFGRRSSSQQRTSVGGPPVTSDLDPPISPTRQPSYVRTPALQGGESSPPARVAAGIPEASPVSTTRRPRPPVTRILRLIVVRGSQPGRQYTVTVRERATFGSGEACDCVLMEPGVAEEQFEISQRDAKLYLRNLSLESPTLVDGAPMSEHHPLVDDALVGNGRFIVRIAHE